MRTAVCTFQNPTTVGAFLNPYKISLKKGSK